MADREAAIAAVPQFDPAAWLHFGFKAYHNVQPDGVTHLYSLDGGYSLTQLLAVYVNGVRQSEHDTYELAADQYGNHAIMFGDGSAELVDDIVTYDFIGFQDVGMT